MLRINLKKFIAIVMLSLTSVTTNAGRGTNDLLLDANVAVRGINLTEAQTALLNEAVESTKKLPDVTIGTKKSFKQTISEAIDRRDATFADLSSVLVTHYQGRLHETVMGHHRIASKWAKFDASLDEKQRLIFRGRMAATITKAFSSMTKNSVYLAKIENLSSDEYVRKLGMSEDQAKTAENLFQDASSQVASLRSKGDQVNINIARALSDPSVDFLEIPESMLDYFNTLTAALKVKRDYGNAFHQTLNEKQQHQLADMVRSKLKLFRFFS
jgi:flavin-binding protein dodecin